MNSNYTKVPVRGMHCRSCELLIEDKLKELPHVQSVDISHKTGEAVIHYSGESLSLDSIKNAIQEAGYEVGISDKLPLLTRDKKEYTNLGIAFLFLMSLYLVLRSLGLTDINLNPDLSSPSYGLIILIGLVAGISTCMALVGGLSLGLSTRFMENHPKAGAAERFRPHLFFVGGRIIGYTLLGGILGALGTVFQLSAAANGVLTILVGLVMLVMGLQLVNIFPRLNNFKVSLPKGVAKVFGLNQKQKEYSHKNAMILGGLTFFLPCGFTQAMQLYAISTGNFLFGAMVMGLFALGTAPGLLSIGGVTSLVRGNLKERFFKVAGLAVIFFSLFNLNNGYTLASLSLGNFNGSDATNSVAVADPNVTLENGVQVVHMTETGSGYSPNSFSIKKGVPVKWVIDAQAPYSCASTLVIPKLGIQKSLVAGENTIEFTPTDSGKLPFSCSMGMYTGVFNVYDGDQPVTSADSASTPTNTAPVTKTGGATCGTSGGAGGCGCGGGGKKIETNTNTTEAQTDSGVQIIKTTFTQAGDIQPNNFTVSIGKPVRLEVYAKEDGTGCMSQIKIQGLYENPQPLVAGQTVVMEFTPTEAGLFNITCAMNVPRGLITVK